MTNDANPQPSAKPGLELPDGNLRGAVVAALLTAFQLDPIGHPGNWSTLSEDLLAYHPTRQKPGGPSLPVTVGEIADAVLPVVQAHVTAEVERARVEGAAQALRLAAEDIATGRVILSSPAAAVIDRLLNQRADRIAAGGEQRG